MLWSWIDVQWPPLLIAAALTPRLLLAAGGKPTLGFALWRAYPNRKAVIGGCCSSALCLLVRPGWVHEWLALGGPDASQAASPAARVGSCCCWPCSAGGGPRRACWRCSALMPQTTALYETLPLALAAERKVEAAAFASLTMVAHLLYLLGPQGPWPVGAEYQWWVMLVLIYLPVLGLVLRRPNERESTWASVVRSQVAAGPNS